MCPILREYRNEEKAGDNARAPRRCAPARVQSRPKASGTAHELLARTSVVARRHEGAG